MDLHCSPHRSSKCSRDLLELYRRQWNVEEGEGGGGGREGGVRGWEGGRIGLFALPNVIEWCAQLCPPHRIYHMYVVSMVTIISQATGSILAFSQDSSKPFPQTKFRSRWIEPHPYYDDTLFLTLMLLVPVLSLNTPQVLWTG